MPFVETVSFSSMGHTYSRSDIDDIQITHYSAGMLETSLAETSKTSPQGFAEIAISYEGSRSSLGTDLDDDVVKSTLQRAYLRIRRSRIVGTRSGLTIVNWQSNTIPRSSAVMETPSSPFQTFTARVPTHAGRELIYPTGKLWWHFRRSQVRRSIPPVSRFRS